MTTALNIRHHLYRSPANIPDPGAGGTIRVDREGGVCHVVTAGAETRTLAAPTKSGINVTVVLGTYGGALTLAVGSDSYVLSMEGDYVQFISLERSGQCDWQMLSQGIAPTNQMVPGSGVAGAAGGAIAYDVEKVGDIFVTRILVNIVGLKSGGTDGDIIGKNAAANSNIGQVTAARNGTIYGGVMTCTTVPTGGSADIDLYSAVEATGTQDAAVSGLTETQLINAGGSWTVGSSNGLAAVPANNEYLYLVGNIGAVVYTAGSFEIVLYGK